LEYWEYTKKFRYTGGGRIKENAGGGEFSYYIL
jgi:hypothetical protein